MDIQIPYSILFTFLCLLILVLKPSRFFKKSNKPLPPGPWKLPFIGNLHQMTGRSPPHHTMKDLANKYGPIFHLQLGEISNVVVSSTEMAKEVMKTHDITFANRPQYLSIKIVGYNCVDIGFSPYGHYWRQLRKICTLELLSVKRVQSFRAIREEEIGSLMNDITEHEGSVINLHDLFFPLANSIVARASIGKSKKVDEVVALMQDTLEMATGLGIYDLFPSLKFLPVITGVKRKLEKLFVVGDKILEEVITEHREKNERSQQNSDEVDQQEDLVDVLLRIQKENDDDIHLSDDAIKAIIQDMFFGATETTATILEWAMSELLRNPETMKEAQADVRKVFGSKGYVDESELHKCKYIDAVVKETLRLHPPLPLLVPRENSKICEINGYEIPYKSRVMVNAWALGRDPKYWKEADRFQPQRFLDPSTDYNFRGMDHEYIPFGSGRRICPGIAFGSAVLDLTVAKLLYHFDWKLPNGMKPEELDMEETFASTATRKNHLCVVATVYHP